MKKINFLLIILSLVAIISCSKEEDDNTTEQNQEEFNIEYSFSVNGVDYSFTDFKVDTSYLSSDNRLFISKTDGSMRFNMNFPMDLPLGQNGMDWNGGGLWFFARIPEGDFYTLDKATCKMNVLSIDKEKRQISATFEGIGSHGVNPETVIIKNGVIKAKY